MAGVRATYWVGSEPRTTVVAAAADVDALASRLLAEAGDALPGIELGRPGGTTLAIAVGPARWALIHTDERFDQRCTRSGRPESGSVDVFWGEPTPIPRSWFVDRPAALVAVSAWLTDRSLTPDLEWSDHCQ